MMKMEASDGWKEALKQKYLNLDSKSRILNDDKANQDDNNNTTVKAMAAAAIGGGAAAGGSSIMAASAATATATATTAGAVSLEALTGGWGAKKSAMPARTRAIEKNTSGAEIRDLRLLR